MSSQEGIIIRLHANEIPVQSRYGSGVRVMRLGENDKVMVLALVTSKNLGNVTLTYEDKLEILAQKVL